MRWAIIVLLAVILVSGCTQVKTNVRTGGLDIKILEPKANSEKYMGEEFNVIMELSNNFIEPIEYNLCLYEGLGLFAGDCRTGSIDEAETAGIGVKPKKIQEIFPETGYYSYINSANLDITGETSSSITAVLEYDVDSDNIADIVICSPRESEKQDISCKAQGIITGSKIRSDNGPIDVNSIKYEFSDSAENVITNLEIEIRKLTNAPETEISFNEKKDRFSMDVYVGDERLLCDKVLEEQNIHQIKENLKTFKCRGKIYTLGQAAMESQISVNLKYKFKVSRSVSPIMIKPLEV